MSLINNSGIYRKFYRNGPSHRDGADVTFRDIIKIFGFKRATIGAWVTQEEQRIAANLFFDALCDLMAILEVNERVISLKGSLSIAFGAGGKKHSSAHYDPSTRTLALAKNAGAGSLAHEYFHAFDHFIAMRFIQRSGPNTFASELWLKKHSVVNHPLNRLLEMCYQTIFLEQNGSEPSALFHRSLAADRALGCYYYATPQEICARAFEAFVQDQPVKNTFLVKGTKQSAEAKIGVYPTGEHRHNINQSLLTYFSTLGLALE